MRPIGILFPSTRGTVPLFGLIPSPLWKGTVPLLSSAWIPHGGPLPFQKRFYFYFFHDFSRSTPRFGWLSILPRFRLFCILTIPCTCTTCTMLMGIMVLCLSRSCAASALRATNTHPLCAGRGTYTFGSRCPTCNPYSLMSPLLFIDRSCPFQYLDRFLRTFFVHSVSVVPFCWLHRLLFPLSRSDRSWIPNIWIGFSCTFFALLTVLAHAFIHAI